MGRGRTAARESNVAEARLYFERALKIDSQSPANLELARLDFDSGDALNAVRHFSAACKFGCHGEAGLGFARALLGTGRAQEALIVLENQLEIDDPLAFHNLRRRIYLRLGSAQDAARESAVIQKLIKLRKRHCPSTRRRLMFVSRRKIVAMFSFGLCLTALRAEDSFDAIRDLLRHAQYEQATSKLDAMQRRPGLSDLDRFNVGWLYGQAHQFRKALELFSSVPAQVPNRVTHDYASALAEVELQDFGAATETLEPVAADAKFGPKQANLLGVALSKTGRLNEAAAIFEGQIETQPGDSAAYFNLSTLLCENGKKAECITAAERTAHAFPESSQAHLVLGAARMENGQINSSRDEFARAHALDPKSPEPVFFVALADYRAQEYGSAITILRAAANDGLRDSDLHYLLAECLVQQGEAPAGEVIQALNTSIEINPTSTAARTLRGKLLLNKYEYGAAAIDLEAALRHDPESRTALYLLARTYQSLGRTQEAQALRSRITSTAEDGVSKVAEGRMSSVFSGGAAH